MQPAVEAISIGSRPEARATSDRKSIRLDRLVEFLAYSTTKSVVAPDNRGESNVASGEDVSTLVERGAAFPITSLFHFDFAIKVFL